MAQAPRSRAPTPRPARHAEVSAADAPPRDAARVSCPPAPAVARNLCVPAGRMPGSARMKPHALTRTRPGKRLARAAPARSAACGGGLGPRRVSRSGSGQRGRPPHRRAELCGRRLPGAGLGRRLGRHRVADRSAGRAFSLGPVSGGPPARRGTARNACSLAAARSDGVAGLTATQAGSAESPPSRAALALPSQARRVPPSTRMGRRDPAAGGVEGGSGSRPVSRACAT